MYRPIQRVLFFIFEVTKYFWIHKLVWKWLISPFKMRELKKNLWVDIKGWVSPSILLLWPEFIIVIYLVSFFKSYLLKTFHIEHLLLYFVLEIFLITEIAARGCYKWRNKGNKYSLVLHSILLFYTENVTIKQTLNGACPTAHSLHSAWHRVLEGSQGPNKAALSKRH